jgi:DNA polymerase-1
VSQLDLLSYVAPGPVVYRDIKPDNVAPALDYARRKLLVIDGTNIAVRAWHSWGRLSRVETFTASLGRVRKLVQPDAVVVVFDGSLPTWRHTFYPAYKASRKPKPDGMREHLDDCRTAATNMPLIRVAMIDDAEADDLIASYVAEAIRRDWETVILSGDRDMLQLVRADPDVTVLDPDPRTDRFWDAAAVVAKYRVGPELVADLKALAGDPSDNYPGVPGLGPIRAAALLAEHGTVESLLDRVNLVRNEKHRQLLLEHAELARTCKRLATLDRDINLPIPFPGARP